MYVCLCNAVTDTEINDAIANGCDDIDVLSMRLGTGLVCGSCRYTIQAMLDSHSEQTEDEATLEVHTFDPNL